MIKHKKDKRNPLNNDRWVLYRLKTFGMFCIIENWSYKYSDFADFGKIVSGFKFIHNHFQYDYRLCIGW